MFGMKQPLDIAFMGGEGRVIALYHDLRPGKTIEVPRQGPPGSRVARRYPETNRYARRRLADVATSVGREATERRRQR